MSQKQNKTTSSEDVLLKSNIAKVLVTGMPSELKAYLITSDDHLLEAALVSLVDNIYGSIKARDAHRDKLIEARARLNTLEDLECDWHSLNSLLREIAKAIKKTEAEIKRLEGEGE